MIDTNNNNGGKATTNSKRKHDSSMSAKVKKSKIVVPPLNDRGTGQLHSFGTGDCGQLGLGHGDKLLKRNYPSPVKDIEGNKILQVAAGGMHTVALDDKGKVWTFGLNDDFALGRPTKEEEDSFQPGAVDLGARNVVQISAGDSHSAALTETGDVYAWGTFKDMNGNFGLIPGNDKKCWDKPQLISDAVNDKVFKIASGDNHLVMLTSDGRIFTCGTGEQGQLGRVVDKRITRSQTKVSTRDLLLTPTEIKIRKKFRDVWCGNFSTYCRTERYNEIWVFGLNNYYQLGLENMDIVTVPTRSPGFLGITWIQIAAGQHHAVALDEDGKVYSLGRGTDGRLGLGEDNAPEAISLPTLIPALTDSRIVQVAAGLSTAYAVAADGKLHAWGCGVNYQLGTGSTDDLYEPQPLEHMVIDGKKSDFSSKAVYVSAGGQHVTVTIRKTV